MRLSSESVLMIVLVLLMGLALLLLPVTNASFLEGSVHDDGGPLAGVRVRYQGQTLRTATDVRGRFRLPQRVPDRNVTAWKQGYFIGSSRQSSSSDIYLTRLPAHDNPLYEWVDPTPNPGESLNCGSCHAEIHREWSESRHARSVTDRRFRNLYEGSDWHDNSNVGWGLLTQYPDGAGVCASCHAPTAKELDLRQVKDVAFNGVHCDYCHKIESVADGTIGLAHGRFNLRLLRPSEGQVSFGPLDDVDRGKESYSPLYHESRYCASCHEGILFGVHVYSTYSEWQASPAARQGKQCQDCHMKPTGRLSNFAPGHGGIPRDPATVANHRFFDGSQEAMLRRAVKASVRFERQPDKVRARVQLWADGVGHRLPTGFVDRHLVLVVEGRDSENRTIPVQAGPTLPSLAGDGLTGRPGRLYARILRDFEGKSPAPFWLASPDPPLDTRLTPGKTEEDCFDFPATLARLHLRVLYRRFWPEVAHSKHWPDDEILILEQSISPCLNDSFAKPFLSYKCPKFNAGLHYSETPASFP